MKFFTLNLLFLVCTVRPAMAQMPLFSRHSVKDISGVRFTTILQERRGWLWFGAKNGLFRYDGMAYQPVGLPDTLGSVEVSAIFESADRLWVGFENGSIGFLYPGTAFFPAQTEQIEGEQTRPTQLERWLPEEGTPKVPIRSFAEDPSGGFWFGTYGEGLYCWKNQRLYQFNKADDGLASDDIYALACDGLGRIWVATDGGVSICTMNEPGRKTVQNLGVAQGLQDEIISTLLPDQQGNIWLGAYDGGVSRFNVHSSRFDFSTPGWSLGSVSSLAWYADAELWVGTTENGLVRLIVPTGAISLLPDNDPLRHANTLTLLKDREGLLWTLADQGIPWSANVRLGMLELASTNVQALCVDSKSRLWTGTSEGLFLQVDGQNRQMLSGRQNVIALAEMPDGTLWAGTFGNGVFILSPDGKVQRHLTERDGLINGSVLSIAGDGQFAWLATLGGVTALDLREGHFEHFAHQDELGTNYIYKVFVDRQKRVWFGTDGKGLSVLMDGSFHHFNEAAGTPLKTIYAITQDLSGDIWFSTEGDGLFRYNGQDFQRYTPANRLHSLAITGLELAGDGELLVAYEDGFDLVNPATGHVNFFETGEMSTAEINLNALCRDGFGNVWMGAQHGIIRLANYQESFLYDPQTSLIEVTVFLKPVDFVNKKSFDYNQNYFIFNFTGLWYANPEAVRYRYRLDNVDIDWKVTKDHLASYPNLPPGRYTFRVQATEHGAFEGTPEALYTFVIQPPIWARWWFIGLCCIGFGGLLYAFVTNREARLRRESRLKRESVESQFAALKSHINPHFLFNSFNTLITIIEENPKIAVEYVEHLADFYRKMMVYREKDLISLQEEMELVRNFDFLLKKRFEDGYRLVMHVNGRPGQIMPLTLQMLVENAVKHNVITQSHPLTVEISVDPDDPHYLRVRNNIQRKIKPEPSTHFGLQSLINRYKLLGELPIVVVETTDYFTVKVPIIKPEN